MYQDPLKYSFELGRFKFVSSAFSVAENSAPYIQNLQSNFTVYATESSKLYVGKLSDFESPKTLEITAAGVQCGNPVDRIITPPLGTETELLIIVRVPYDVLDDTCILTIKATDNDKKNPMTLEQQILINVIAQKFQAVSNTN